MTDVVEALSRDRNVPAERRAEVFRAAQQVCAEELRLARTGFAPASLSELVDRAVTLLPADLGGQRHPVRGWEEDAPFPEEPAESFEPLASPGDPFESLSAAAAGEEPFAIPSRSAPAEEPPAPAEEPEEETPEESEEPEEIEFARVDGAPKSSSGKLATVLLLIAIGGGVWFFARTRRAAPPPPAPTDASPAPEGVPVFPAETASPTPVPATSELSKPSSPAPPATAPPRATAAPTPEIPESRGSSMIAPEWAGHPPAWMIHFSSYQRKENADRDAARLEKLLRRPLRVVSVNLGAQGPWYRVMLGDFDSREEAQRERDALVANGTPGVGLVYRVEAPPSARVAPAR